MSRRTKTTFENVIALRGVQGVTEGTKGLVTGSGFRSMSILWTGRTIPSDYERPGIDVLIVKVKAEPRPANQVSKHKKTQAPAEEIR